MRLHKTFLTLLCLSISLFALSAREADRPLRVLAIGNSFSVDAVENHLAQLAAADGFALEIGNLYIGGCSLERHARNARENRAEYSYRKIVGGKLRRQEGTTLETALLDGPWDVITFQQNSPNSGLYDTYFPYLDELMAYVRERVGEEPLFLFHQTWAYAPDSNHDKFVNYDRNQQKMYEAIAQCTRRISRLEGIDGIIPSGTAIQNARTSSMGRDLTRDGYHLHFVTGRYIAACTWYEILSGRSVIGNAYCPARLSQRERCIAQRAAHKAKLRKFCVSEINL